MNPRPEPGRPFRPPRTSRPVPTASLMARRWFARPMAVGAPPSEVRGMFARIAPAYDRGNALLSLGVHKVWKRRAVRAARLPRGGAALDVATGTGDLAFLLARDVSPTGRVVGLDFTEPMLRIAKAKRSPARGAPVEWIAGDATRLPVADASFDAATIAFGIRNVQDRIVALREMRRAVRPGGRVVVLEFGRPRGLLGGPYRFYSRTVLPAVGGLVSGDRAAYEYLEKTSAAFPSGEAFLDLAREAGGFSALEARPLTGGIAWVYVLTVA